MDWVHLLKHWICPIAVVVISNAMYFTPLSSLNTAVARGTLGPLNPVPWAFMTGSCLGGAAYAYLRRNLFLFLSNAPGIVVSLWLNMGAAKLQYHRDPGGSTPQERMVSAVVLIWIVVLTGAAALSPGLRVEVVGVCVNANLIVFFWAPLSTIRTVMREKDSRSIHVGTMVVNCANSVFWCAYGLVLWDFFVLAPSLVGLCFGIAQVILYVGCRRKEVSEEEEMVGEVLMENVIC